MVRRSVAWRRELQGGLAQRGERWSVVTQHCMGSRDVAYRGVVWRGMRCARLWRGIAWSPHGRPVVAPTSAPPATSKTKSTQMATSRSPHCLPQRPKLQASSLPIRGRAIWSHHGPAPESRTNTTPQAKPWSPCGRHTIAPCSPRSLPPGPKFLAG